MVGSVIVYNNVIIGEGWHYQAGQPHAEVNAINSVKDKSLLKEATIYVSLEPCSHFGKTPPCANLIIEHQIPNVVIGCIDSFSKVSGKGIEKLQNNGCKVIVGVLEEECTLLNKRFFTFHNKKRPYVILKWAESDDGYISPHHKGEDTIGPVWITNTYSRQLVHKLRAEEQAILVGTNTAITDNPKLDCRTWKGNNPVRIVLDRTLRIPNDYHLFDGNIKTIVFFQEDQKEKIATRATATLLFEAIDFSNNVPTQICDVLYKHQLQSVIIEGGSKILQHFIDTNLWDEARVFKGKTTFSEGLKAPKLKGIVADSITIKEDTLAIYNNESISSM